MTADRPPVLFLAGIGRSGTTLVERVLGEVPGVLALGEVLHLWERGLGLGERCGCGEVLTGCGFWQEIGGRAFGGWDRVDLHRVAALRRRVDRASRVPALARGSARREVVEYAELYSRVYGAAAQVTGAEVVVDSSKQVSLAWCLALSGRVDLRLAHCVRDARAVAHSWSREVARPEAVDREHAQMPRYAPAYLSALWVLHNLEAEVLSRRVPSVRLRYEDFVDDPPAHTRRLLGLVGLGDTDLAHVAPTRVRLSRGHSCAGNPMRFQEGEVQVRADERWRREQPVGRTRLVTALSAPVLHRYDYLWGGTP